VAEAVRLVAPASRPDCEGEMQVQIALDPETRKAMCPHTALRGEPNVFIFPNLSASNTAYQMLARTGGVDEIGPLLLGLNRPVTVVPPRCTVDGIVQLAAMTALHAQGEPAPE
jgi:malate dehydrogenase (oxaloacetate-decarboxylating)(NADP+)